MTYDALAKVTDVVVERILTTSLPQHDICLSDPELAACLDIYQVEWRESFISADRKRLICHFRAPDTESVRVVLRNTGITSDAIWFGRMFGDIDAVRANVVVEHCFAERTPVDAAEAIQIVKAERLVPSDLKLRRAIVSRDCSRILCICDAADALRQFEGNTWRCDHLLAHFWLQDLPSQETTVAN